jgi:hypothetical protein
MTIMEIHPTDIQPGDHFMTHEGDIAWTALDNAGTITVPGQTPNEIAVTVQYADGGTSVRLWPTTIHLIINRP